MHPNVSSGGKTFWATCRELMERPQRRHDVSVPLSLPNERAVTFQRMIKGLHPRRATPLSAITPNLDVRNPNTHAGECPGTILRTPIPFGMLQSQALVADTTNAA